MTASQLSGKGDFTRKSFGIPKPVIAHSINTMDADDRDLATQSAGHLREIREVV